MSLSPSERQIVDRWLSDLKSHTSTNLADDPNYYIYKPEDLITASQPETFVVGTGQQVVQDILTAFQGAQHEIILVTCFWAKSTSQIAVADALRSLSLRALAEGRRIRVRICLSSLSIWQKLTQTGSLSGKEYAPSSWEGNFGLPKPSELKGVDLIIRSVFVWPISVMHPKFVIIDRERMFLPSCNISWEDWFEGCIGLRGGIVDQTLLFWAKFWGRDETFPLLDLSRRSSVEHRHSFTRPLLDENTTDTIELGTNTQEVIFQASLSHLGIIPAILLPSPHHRNPSFRPMPWSSAAPAPPSPLNTFLLTIVNTARQSIYMQSPNVNSAPVIFAILSALQRGVNVKIVTNTNMMIVEQLVTAGTLTECALRRLHRKWTQMCSRNLHEADTEAGRSPPGTLKMFYYDPLPNRHGSSGVDTAVKSHLKLTVVDDEIVVLGSGNMDRASWYTSQELGVAFFSRDFANEVMDSLTASLEGHLRNAISV